MPRVNSLSSRGTRRLPVPALLRASKRLRLGKLEWPLPLRELRLHRRFLPMQTRENANALSMNAVAKLKIAVARADTSFCKMERCRCNAGTCRRNRHGCACKEGYGGCKTAECACKMVMYSCKTEFAEGRTGVFVLKIACFNGNGSKRAKPRASFPLFSQFAREITHSNPQSPSDTPQSFQSDPLLGSFNLTDVISSEVCFFGELFLAQPSLDSLGANCFAERFV